MKKMTFVKKAVILSLGILIGLLSCSLDQSVLNSPESFAEPEAPEGAELVFSSNQEARGITNSAGTKYVTVTESPSGMYHLKINLRPYGAAHYRKVLFSVYNETTATGWTVNIGDSPTNDGWGGDYNSQTNDCEIQVLNGTYSVYASDSGSSALLYSATGYNVQTGSRNVRYEISNNTVRTWKNSDTSNVTTITNPNLFALDGRNDAAGPEDYVIYAGFNRTINSSARSGSGIYQVYVYVQDKIDYELIPVNQDYSATLRHLMYKTSTVSSKWYANTDFPGYTYFLNGKNKDNWDEPAKEHIFAVEYWNPGAANIKNVVLCVAGQQGLLADRQDYEAIVTGQKEDWHHYSGAPWNAINTWKYMKNASKPINWKSIAGQIIADGEINGGSYFGFTPDNTLLLMVFDACFYWGDISASAKTALVTDYLEWMFSRTNNNSANRIRNFYLAGASRGGALVTRMAYEMRHTATWKSYTGSARIIVSGFDAVANHEEGELWTNSTRVDNPLEWINTRFCYDSNLPDNFTNRSNTYLLQIAGGADVVPALGAKYHAFYFDEVPGILEFNWVDRSHSAIGREWHGDTSEAHLKWLAQKSLKYDC